ncbi:MAG: hypothetical protein QNJ58_10690 [Desulfobacterales bacterium]|nr:hypothetical protein [Desulfobacterales bacterium]
MELSELNDATRQFMIQLMEETNGDQSAQISMYEVGSSLGLDRDDAARVAEELMGLQLVEIRTLSGGIGMSAAGFEMMQELLGPIDMASNSATRLGDEPILTAPGREAVVEIINDIKRDAGTLGLDFDSLSELMADLKSIDAQLESSRPKTAILRACFISICQVLKTKPETSLIGKINGLIGD